MLFPSKGVQSVFRSHIELQRDGRSTALWVLRAFSVMFDTDFKRLTVTKTTHLPLACCQAGDGRRIGLHRCRRQATVVVVLLQKVALCRE